MADLCAYQPCKCRVDASDMFCGEVCAMLGAQTVNRVRVAAEMALRPDDQVVPRCACGHDGCGDSLVSGRVN